MSLFNDFRAILIAFAICFAAMHSTAQTPEKFAEQAATAASASEKSAQIAAKSAAAAASAASAAMGFSWSAPHIFWQVAIPAVTFVAALMSILSVRGALLKTNWSLADALSEETQLSYYIETTTTDAAGNKVTVKDVAKDKDGKPALITELRASTSRVIALMGMMVILFLFVGFGVFAMFSFGATGALPDSMNSLIKFLVSGMTLFAPYVVNKFSSLFSGLSGGK